MTSRARHGPASEDRTARPSCEPLAPHAQGRLRGRAGLAAVLLGAACAVGAACGSQEAATGRPLRVAVLPYLSFGPIFIAHDEGEFASVGLEVDLVRFGRSVEAIPALDRGDLDVAGGTLSLALFNAVARGSRVRIVADKGYVPRDGCAYSGLVARRALGAEPRLTREGLRGLRIAADRTSYTGYYLDRMLASLGLGVDDVELVNVPDEILGDALDRGRVDLAHTTEPWLSRLLSEGHGHLWVSPKDVLPESQYAYVFFGPTLLERSPDTGYRFLEAYLRGVRRYLEGKTPRNLAILAARTGLGSEWLAAACWPGFRADGGIDPGSLGDFQRWGRSKGLLEAELPAGLLWDAGFVREASRRISGPGVGRGRDAVLKGSRP
jgi:NitT/TauT family transport system substrate-binding protein